MVCSPTLCILRLWVFVQVSRKRRARHLFTHASLFSPPYQQSSLTTSNPNGVETHPVLCQAEFLALAFALTLYCHCATVPLYHYATAVRPIKARDFPIYNLSPQSSTHTQYSHLNIGQDMSTSAPTRAPPKVNPRPIPSRSQAPSFSIVGSEEKVVLKYALNNMTPEDLYQRLSDSVDKLLPAEVEKLNKALESTGIVFGRSREAAKDSTVRHCLRCHRAYLERNNGLNGCVVLHYQPVPDPRAGEIGRMLFPCCGGRSDLGARANQCFRGRHTTEAANVNYAPHTVKTCEQAKCVPNTRQA